MRVLVACEFSGVVREAFIARGHDAWSCDLEPGLGKLDINHIRCDVLEVLNQGWDLMIAHPPCTYLASSGLHWEKKDPQRVYQRLDAFDFVLALRDANIPQICIENPIGALSTMWRKPDQIIQPYQFGHDASKATCLWLQRLPLLKSTRVLNYLRYANQTASGQNKLSPGPQRARLRSITYKGIARAMAKQWG